MQLTSSVRTYSSERLVALGILIVLVRGCRYGGRAGTHHLGDFQGVLLVLGEIGLGTVLIWKEREWFQLSGSNIIQEASPFKVLRVSIPPSDTRDTFHRSRSTFFIGKCGARPLQNFVIIPSSLTESSSSPMGYAGKVS